MHNKGIQFFNLCKFCHGIPVFYTLSDKVCETLYTGYHPRFSEVRVTQSLVSV